jgi:hypothetical protein
MTTTGSLFSRRNRRKSPAIDASQAFSDTAKAHVFTDTSDPIVYAPPARSGEPNQYENLGLIGPLDANDDPPSEWETEPEGRVIVGSGIGKIGIWPDTLTGSAKVAVWTKVRVASIEEGHEGEASYVWVCTGVVDLGGDADLVEVVVPTRFRDVFVQVVEGATEETPVTLRIGAC